MVSIISILSSQPLLPLLTPSLLLHPKRDALYLKQHLFQVLLAPELLDPYLVLPHQQFGDLLLHLGVLRRCPLDYG